VRPRVAGCCLVEDPRTAIEPHYILIIRTEKRQPLASLPLAISASPSLGKQSGRLDPDGLDVEIFLQVLQAALAAVSAADRDRATDSGAGLGLGFDHQERRCLCGGRPGFDHEERRSLCVGRPPCRALDAARGGCLCVGRPMGDWLPVR
jgi:hypothetical protein